MHHWESNSWPGDCEPNSSNSLATHLYKLVIGLLEQHFIAVTFTVLHFSSWWWWFMKMLLCCFFASMTMEIVTAGIYWMIFVLFQSILKLMFKSQIKRRLFMFSLCVFFLYFLCPRRIKNIKSKWTIL